MFNSLVVKEEGTIKIVDGSTCKVISTGTINVTCKVETVRALEAVWYISEARCNLIFIEVLDEEGYWIQVQQSVITVIQGDRVILEEEKCGGIYKLKEELSLR